MSFDKKTGKLHRNGYICKGIIHEELSDSELT